MKGAAADVAAHALSLDAPLSVSALAGRIDQAVRSGLPQRVRVIGEVTGFRDRTHWYFDLKDADAIINCVMFIQQARRAGPSPENGRQVIVSGRAGFYAKGGKLTLTVDSLEAAGEGALDRIFRERCAELRALGWFTPERKRPLPSFPRRIAVLTSRTGAALQDVLDTIRRRCPAVDVAVVDALMQGNGSAGDIVAKIRAIGQQHRRLGIEVLLLTRGGGSPEDLQAFNDRDVAEAVLNCPIPVIAAIGHETDTTIAELVADARAATPTQAAMRATPDAAALQEQVSNLQARIRSAVVRRIRFERERLRSASRHPAISDPGALVRASRERLDRARRHALSAATARLRMAVQRQIRVADLLEGVRPARRIQEWRAHLGRAESGLRQAAERFAGGSRVRLEALARELDAVGPAGVLARGYSVTMRPDGTIVRSAAEVAAGDAVRTRVADGTFGSVVSGGARAEPPARPPVSIKRPFSRGKRSNPNQMDLFAGPPPQG